MPDYDAGFKIAARVSGDRLAEVGGVHATGWEPIVGEVQTTTRFADRAFKARERDELFLVYMEAYTRWKSTAPWSVWAKSGMLSERERLPTLSLVYVLLPRGYRSQHGGFRLTALGRPTQQVWFREICFWRVRPKRWWEEAPGLMTLYPLCNHGRSESEVITHAASSISANVQDAVMRADLLTTLAIFGKLAYPGMKVLDLIGREKMRESKFFDEVIAEGRLEASRKAVLEVVKARFGPESVAETAHLLAAIDDDERLLELVGRAATCRRFSQFRQQTESLIATAK